MEYDVDRRGALAAAGAGLLALSGAAAAQAPAADGAIAVACAAYMDAWARKDLAGIARQIHPDVHFLGPMVDTQGRDAFLRSSEGIFRLLERIDLRGTFIAGNRAMFAYDFVCGPPIGIVRTGELVDFDGGLIRRIELFYDARPFEAARRAAAS
jgi:hypothetical protein